MRKLFMAAMLINTGIAVSGQDFETEIRPLLVSQCQACHNDSNRTSGLSLASRAGIAEGGTRGPAADWILRYWP